MSHIAALMVDIVAPIGCAGSVYYADKSALKGTLLQTLQVTREMKFKLKNIFINFVFGKP